MFEHYELSSLKTLKTLGDYMALLHHKFVDVDMHACAHHVMGRDDHRERSTEIETNRHTQSTYAEQDRQTHSKTDGRDKDK